MRITFAHIIVCSVLLMSCGSKQNIDEHAGHDQTTQGVATKYTCSMHPQIVRDQPGTCPICGMDLVKVTKSEASGDDLMLSDTQIMLANITTQKAIKKPIGETVVINATLTIDEQKSEVISSRATGRIEKLYVKETGQMVKKGESLYVLFSESLLTLQQEYLLAKEQYETLGKGEKRYESFLKGAERKLLLYGLTQKQINQLTDRTALEPRITFLSPASGLVTTMSASEGQYVEEGTLLYQVEDISSLWVEAELYPEETSLVKRGDKIQVTVAGFESNRIEAQVTFLSPEYRANTQITIMRAEIKNRQQQFKPGQQAQVYFSHSNRDAIAIPVDAVIRDGKGTHVYVQVGNNTFRPRMVKTGVESVDQVEIIEGINEGDTVAVSGAYLLYSEIVLKKGTDPMAGHNH